MPVSQDLARVLTDDFGVPEQTITVVPNIAADVFRPATPPLRTLPSSHGPRSCLAATEGPRCVHRALGPCPRSCCKAAASTGSGTNDYQRIIECCIEGISEIDILELPGCWTSRNSQT